MGFSKIMGAQILDTQLASQARAAQGEDSHTVAGLTPSTGCATRLHSYANSAQMPPSSCSCGFGGDSQRRGRWPAGFSTKACSQNDSLVYENSTRDAGSGAGGAMETTSGGRAPLGAPGAGFLKSAVRHSHTTSTACRKADHTHMMICPISR